VKHQNKQRAANRQRRQEAEVITRAYKAVGTKDILPGLNPAADIAAIEKYLVELEKLRKELINKYGHLDLTKVLRTLEVEEQQALETLTKIKLGQVDPILTSGR
jgi:hypothetical protein